MLRAKQFVVVPEQLQWRRARTWRHAAMSPKLAHVADLHRKALIKSRFLREVGWPDARNPGLKISPTPACQGTTGGPLNIL